MVNLDFSLNNAVLEGSIDQNMSFFSFSLIYILSPTKKTFKFAELCMKEEKFGKTEKINFANFYLFAILGSNILIQFERTFWLGLLSKLRHCPSLMS